VNARVPRRDAERLLAARGVIWSSRAGAAQATAASSTKERGCAKAWTPGKIRHLGARCAAAERGGPVFVAP
jgi:hypothetical protein